MDQLVQILLFLILGILLYYIDSLVGTGLYRGFYNLTHKDELDPAVRKGFLVDRSAGHRLGWAVAIVVIASGIAFLSGAFFGDRTLENALLVVTMFVGLLLGFLFAPTVVRFLPGALKRSVDYVESIESGESSIGDDLRSAATKAGKKIVREAVAAGEKVKDTVEDAKEELRGKEKEEARKPDPDPDEGKDDDEPPRDWRGGVKDFLDKG